MRTPYPTCDAVSILESLPEGQIVFLKGWTLTRHGSGEYSLFDGIGGMIRLHSVPDDWHQKYFSNYHIMHGMDLYVRVGRTEPDYGGFYMGMPVVRHVEIHVYHPTPPQCNCGAIHDRDFPNTHSHWCDSYEWR